MNILKKFSPCRKPAFLLLSMFALSLQACNTTGTDDHHEHHDDVWGIILTQDGEEIARHFGDSVTYIDDEPPVVAADEESSPFTVQFLTEEGEAITPDAGTYHLSWNIDLPDRLELVHHAEDGPWSFRMKGLSPGNAQVEFALLHGQEDPHPDFVSLPFDVQID